MRIDRLLRLRVASLPSLQQRSLPISFSTLLFSALRLPDKTLYRANRTSTTTVRTGTVVGSAAAAAANVDSMIRAERRPGLRRTSVASIFAFRWPQ